MPPFVALTGCGLLLFRNHMREHALPELSLCPLVGIALWFVAPHETLERLSTIADQLRHGDLNQRLNIWAAGWHAFVQAPCSWARGRFLRERGGPCAHRYGAQYGSFASGGRWDLRADAGVRHCVPSPRDRRWQPRVQCGLRCSLCCSVWIVSSLVGTVAESRTTWLLLALIALADRVAGDEAEGTDCEHFLSAGESSSRIERVIHDVVL